LAPTGATTPTTGCSSAPSVGRVESITRHASSTLVTIADGVASLVFAAYRERAF
jgi:hypothetical protein